MTRDCGHSARTGGPVQGCTRTHISLLDHHVRKCLCKSRAPADTVQGFDQRLLTVQGMDQRLQTVQGMTRDCR
ncbi:unnamed protein product, partial [Staurois parvus]